VRRFGFGAGGRLEGLWIGARRVLRPVVARPVARRLPRDGMGALAHRRGGLPSSSPIPGTDRPVRDSLGVSTQ